MRQAVVIVAALALFSSARAQDQPESLSISLAQQRLAAQEQAAASSDAPPAVPDKRFGTEGVWWWGVGGMGALSDDAFDAQANATFRVFLAQDFEFNLSLAGWGFFQEGQDAAGINPGLGFRWHFVNNLDRGYSIYADAGIGLLWASDEVPDEGTRFNFTPRVGVGTTIALGDGPARLDLGVGWQHISNASTSGTDDNPARDSIALWIGVMFPF